MPKLLQCEFVCHMEWPLKKEHLKLKMMQQTTLLLFGNNELHQFLLISTSRRNKEFNILETSYSTELLNFLFYFHILI